MTSLLSIFQRAWYYLVRPSDSIESPLERRNARFILTWMTLGFPIVAAVVIILPWLENISSTVRIWLWLNLGMGLFVYLLARTRHYYIACILEVGLLWLGTVVMSFVLPERAESLGFLVVPVLLSATVLSLRFTMYTALLSMLTVPVMIPFLSEPDYHGLLHSGLLLMAGNAFIVAGRLHQRRQAITSAEILREREGRHFELLEAAFDGTAKIHENRIIEVSADFASVFDTTPNRLIGTVFTDLISPKQRALLTQVLDQGTGTPVEFRTEGTHSTRWLEFVSQSHLDTQKREMSLVAIRDITDRHNLRNQLLFADRMMSMGTLAAGVAHEINNPLTYLLANQASLENQVPPMLRHIDPLTLNTIQRKLNMMGEGLDRIRQIVQDLSTFSRVDDDQSHCVDVHVVADWAVNMAWNEIRHRAKFIKTYDPIPAVGLNEARLGQVLLNLLLNAAQALPDGQAEDQTIHLRTSTDEQGQAIIQVTDTGPGIPNDVMELIFEPFFTTKPLGQGTGLGLSVCHFIVKNASGTIDVDTSENGTCFTLTLPPTQESIEPVPELPPVEEDPAHGNIRVLVVDDEPAIADLLTDILGDYDVTSATSGREAIAEWKQSPFDLIICDLMMPDISGIEVYRFLESRKRGEHEKMIFLTGGAFSTDAWQFLNESTNQLLHKPFFRNDVRRAVSNLEPGSKPAPVPGAPPKEHQIGE